MSSTLPEVSQVDSSEGVSSHGSDPEWINNIPPWYYRGWEAPPQDKKHFAGLTDALLDQDAKKCAGWKEEVQNLLILAGLFSAIVTAFVVQSYQALRPDPNDQIISLLARIADQTAVSVANASTNGALIPTSSDFSPSPSSIRVNIFWFISLVLSLTVALIGIIALQWLREHQLYENGIGTQESFAIFNSRNEAMKRWYVSEIFASLPLLLQAAIVLFFVGLIDFLFSIRLQVAIAVSVAISIPLLFLVATTILPTLQLYSLHLPRFFRVNDYAPAPCPYKSPQALILRQVAVFSKPLFNQCAWAFAALCTPSIVIMRLLSRRSSKPFYGKSAPFSADISLYRDSVLRIQRIVRGWTPLDMEWLTARTSYAVEVYYPTDCRHFEWSCYDDNNTTGITTYYDCITGIKNMISDSNPTDKQQKDRLFGAMKQVLWGLSEDWADPLDRGSTDPEVRTALQGHFTALLNIISPKQHGFTLKSSMDAETVYNSFLDIFLAEPGMSQTLPRLQLELRVRKLFGCSNMPCIRPPLSLSARRSLTRNRADIELRNPSWMEDKSREWTRTLSEIIEYSQKIIPQQPFTRKCNGSSAHACGSNLHTDSIIELTEFILTFQLAEDINKILDQLDNLIHSKQRPIHDAPFVMIIACAYINACANVDFRFHDPRLLRTLCGLCGSLNPTIKRRPGGTAKYWPAMESAFEYIRSHCLDKNKEGATAKVLASNVSNSAGSDENV